MTNPYGPPSGPQSFGQPSGGCPQQPGPPAPQQPGQPMPQQPGQPVPQYGAPAGGAHPPGYHPAGELASWGTRFLGRLVDGGIVFVGVLVVSIVFGLLTALIASGGSSGAVATAAGIWVVGYLIMLGGGAAFTIWNSAYRRGTTGQTIGQKMVKIKTVSEQTGQPVGFGNAFLRELCHALDSLACYVGFLAPLWDEKRQTWADKIMQTVVVRADDQPGAPQAGYGQPGYPQQQAGYPQPQPGQPQQPGFPPPPGYGQ